MNDAAARSAAGADAVSADDRALLDALGMARLDDLFADIPAALQTESFDLPPAASELELARHMAALAEANAGAPVNFCGGGVYDHFIPAAVDALAGRAEFYTAYTPYQPEVSQGTLQAIYEYQTAIVRLTGLEAANASLYDGGTALFEAVMMAFRATRRRRALIDAGVNPLYRALLRTYAASLDIELVDVPLRDGRADRDAFRARLTPETGAVVLQNPNFFGCLDDLSDLVEAAHAQGALGILSVYPLALGLLRTPGSMGADIATGEGQSLGLPLSFGGPYLGFMAARKGLVHKMPGRLVGATRDAAGRRGFVLTLQAREQHIRREKATSNICTAEALCALRAVIYLSLLGKAGLVEAAEQCAALAAYGWRALTAVPGVAPAFRAPFFNEFAITLPVSAETVAGRLLDRGIAAGIPLGRFEPGLDRVLLVAFTERRTREEIDALAGALAAAL